MPPQISMADLIRMLGPTKGSRLLRGYDEPTTDMDIMRQFGDPNAGMDAITPGWPQADIPQPPYIMSREDPGVFFPMDSEEGRQTIIDNQPLGGLEAEVFKRHEEMGPSFDPEEAMMQPEAELERMPTDEMLLMPPEELEDIPFDAGPGVDPSPLGEDVGLGPGFDPELIGEERPRETAPIPARAPWDEDPLMARPDIPRAQIEDVPGDFVHPIPIRAPGAPWNMPEDPGFTQADMEETMEKHGIYGGPTPIAPRVARKPQLSPERQRELAQRKFLSRFMHPSVRFMFGNPKAWPYLSQMELGRMQADTQGEALRESRAERIARDAMAQRQFQWQMSQGTRQFESTERARLEALGFSREEAAARAKESADKLALVREQGESTERIRGMEFKDLQQQRAAERETEGRRFQSEQDARQQQHDERMAQFDAQIAQAKADRDDAKAARLEVSKQREEEQSLKREESVDIRKRESISSMRERAEAMRTSAADPNSLLNQPQRDSLNERARKLDEEADGMEGLEPPPVETGGGELGAAPGQVVPGRTGVGGITVKDAENQLDREAPGFLKQLQAQLKKYGETSRGGRNPVESTLEWFSTWGKGDYAPGDVNSLWYLRSFVNDAIKQGHVTNGNIEAVGKILLDGINTETYDWLNTAERDEPGTKPWFEALKAGRMPAEHLLRFHYR